MTLPSHRPLQVLNERRCGDCTATQGLKSLMCLFCYSKNKADCVFGGMHIMCSCFLYCIWILALFIYNKAINLLLCNAEMNILPVSHLLISLIKFQLGFRPLRGPHQIGNFSSIILILFQCLFFSKFSQQNLSRPAPRAVVLFSPLLWHMLLLEML